MSKKLLLLVSLVSWLLGFMQSEDAEAQSNTRAEIRNLANEIIALSGDRRFPENRMEQGLIHMYEARSAITGTPAPGQMAQIIFECDWTGDLKITVISDATGNEESASVRVSNLQLCREQAADLSQRRSRLNRVSAPVAACDWKADVQRFQVYSDGRIDFREEIIIGNQLECKRTAQRYNQN
jgi:hypothetical protein